MPDGAFSVSKRMLTITIAVLLSQRALAMSDDELRAVLGKFDERRDAMLRKQVAKPYPPEGPWHYIDFALAALLLNEKADEANAALLKMAQAFPCDPTPARDKKGRREVNDYHWQINLLQRIWFLFNSKSKFHPGRLSPEVEAKLLGIFWDSARKHCRIEYADPARVWWMWGSENHGAMSRSGFWGAAHILKDAPGYRDKRYADGSTPAQMAAAWDAYYKRYARERAAKGLLVEVGSTYNKYTLQGWYNMADFAEDAELRRRMKMLLDLFWADWAIEQINGVRGGAKHRIYAGRTSTRGAFFSGQGMACYYFGLGNMRSQHPGHMCAATSFYRPPLCVADMALDVEGRGVYEYVSRRPGLNLLPKPAAAGWDHYVLRGDYGGILRYTYCTPDFIMGTSMVEPRPHEEWAAISSQNRWDGILFAGHPDAVIFAQPLKPKRGSVYNSHWSVQRKGVLILQKLRTHRHARGQRVWFPECLKRVEEAGWVFVEAPHAYAAVRVVQGETEWVEDARQAQAPGQWLECKDPFSAIIMEAARKRDYSDFAACRAATQSNPMTLDGGKLSYRSSLYNVELAFYPDSKRLPEVDGKPIDMRPKKVYDSPFIQGDWGSGVVVLKKGEREEVLDFRGPE